MMSDGNHDEQSHGGVGARRALAGTARDARVNQMETKLETNAMRQLYLDAYRLRNARMPGKGRPRNVDEALAVIGEQAETFDWWVNNGPPLGEIRAWVDGQEVMCARPKSPAKVKTFTFVMPSRESQVLQITTKVEDRLVVLYTLPLREVPADGLELPLPWSNGQSILLKISHEEKGEWSVEVAINPHRAGESVGDEGERKRRAARATAEVESMKEEEPKAKAAGVGSTFALGLQFLSRLLPTFMPKPSRVAGAVSLGLVMVALLGANSLSRHQEPVVQRVDSSEQSATISTADTSTQLPAEQTPTGETAAAATEPAADTSPAPAAKTKEVKGVKAGGTSQALETASTAGATESRAENVPASHEQSAGTERSGETVAGAELPARVSPSKEEQNVKLATLRSFYVKLDGRRLNLSTENNKLHEAVVRALEDSESFVVLGETDRQRADAVISLRFWASDENRKDAAIYANVRDLSGNVLWDELVSCTDLQDQNQRAALDDASVRLVNKLKEVVGLAQQSSKHTE
jgi:hypothetical protein